MTNFILTEKITTSYSTLINSQTTHQLSPNKYNRWSAGEYLIYLVVKNTLIKLHTYTIMDLNLVSSMKIMTLLQHPQQEETITEKPMVLYTITNVGRIFLQFIDGHFPNTASYSIETILRSAAVVCQIWQVSFEATAPVYWKTLSQLTSKNEAVFKSQNVHWTKIFIWRSSV